MRAWTISILALNMKQMKKSKIISMLIEQVYLSQVELPQLNSSQLYSLQLNPITPPNFSSQLTLAETQFRDIANETKKPIFCFQQKTSSILADTGIKSFRILNFQKFFGTGILSTFCFALSLFFNFVFQHQSSCDLITICIISRMFF